MTRYDKALQKWKEEIGDIISLEKLLDNYSKRVNGKESILQQKVNKYRQVAKEFNIGTDDVCLNFGEKDNTKYPSELETIVINCLFACYLNYMEGLHYNYSIESYIFKYWDKRIESELLKNDLDADTECLYITDEYGMLYERPDAPNTPFESKYDDNYKEYLEIEEYREILLNSKLSDEYKIIISEMLDFKPKSKKAENITKEIEKRLQKVVGLYTDDFNNFVKEFIKDVKNVLSNSE